MEKQTDLEIFLQEQKKKNIKRFAGWMVVLILLSVGTIGGVFFLFDVAVEAFVK